MMLLSLHFLLLLQLVLTTGFSYGMTTPPLITTSSNGNNNNNNVNVVIVGGGLAGLSTAIALRPLFNENDATTTVTILESCSRHEFDNESAGAAVQLTPNGLRALRLLSPSCGEDILQAVLEHSCEIDTDVAILPSNDKLFDNIKVTSSSSRSSSERDSLRLPTVMIRWGELRKILGRHLPSETIVFDQKIDSIEDIKSSIAKRSAGVAAVNHDDDDDESKEDTVTSSTLLVVAANGKNSFLRPTPLESTRRVNFKAVIPTSQPPPTLPRVPSSTQAEKTTFAWFSPTGSVACFLGPAGRKWSYTYWAISVQVVNDQDLDFYNSNNNDPAAIKTKLLQTLRDTKQDESKVYADLIEQTLPESIYVEMSAQAQLPDSFVVQQDNNIMLHNTVLVGDAAHTMMASYGQAASFALEDAVTLAHCMRQRRLQQRHQGDEKTATSISAALQDYSHLRRQRCLEMQQRSHERVTKSIKGESVDDITAWIHDFKLDASASS